ncbi:MAG: 50S ribosomal protein L29 [Puniceicoccales bacterium]|jgi:large subunit ribosomal protein L29|nr:50S ribosomal protein L29 [Puniceicoccales bacterium]
MTDKIDYSELSIIDLRKKLEKMHEELFQLRLKKSSAQLENSASITKTRKEIAKIETFLRQKACKFCQTLTC